MRTAVVELSQDGLYAKIHRGFLQIYEGDKKLGQVVIDDMACLILTAPQSTLSKTVMVRLAEAGIPIIISGSNYHPIAYSLPYSAHHQSTKILRWQIAASEPLKKRLWQQLVQQKIQHQRLVLSHQKPQTTTAQKRLQRLAQDTRSGDTTNCEAQAAKIYWQALLPENKKRDQEGTDFINSALNYGYAIIRAATARALCSAGLNPGLGLHHHNQGNPFCLADDLMEIFRPLVDFHVLQIPPSESLQPEHKRDLARLLDWNLKLRDSETIVNTALQDIAYNLANSLSNKKAAIDFPTFVYPEASKKPCNRPAF